MTQEALMPRPPADSRLEVTYARSSNTRRSTVMVLSMAGLTVRVTIKTLILAECGDATLKIAPPSGIQTIHRPLRGVFLLGNNVPGHPHEPGNVSPTRAGRDQIHPFGLDPYSGGSGTRRAPPTRPRAVARRLKRHPDSERRKRMSDVR